MKIDISLILLIAYLGRLLVFGANIGDAVSFVALSALFAFSKFLTYKKEPEINTLIKADIESMKKDLDEMKKTVSVFKLGTNLRGR